MRDKLIEIIENGERKVLGHTIRGTSYYTEALADLTEYAEKLGVEL